MESHNAMKTLKLVDNIVTAVDVYLLYRILFAMLLISSLQTFPLCNISLHMCTLIYLSTFSEKSVLQTAIEN